MTVSSFFMRQHWGPGEPKVINHLPEMDRDLELILVRTIRTYLTVNDSWTKTSLKRESIGSFVEAGFIPQLALPTWDTMGPPAPFSAQASRCMQMLPHRRSSRPFQLFLSTTKLTKEKKPYELLFFF